MRRNKLFILGLFFAFVAVLSLTLVSGTWAKYTSTVTSADAIARVAKWEWNIGEQEVVGDTPISTKFAFNLFDTINDTYNDGDNHEEDVATSESAKIIAPGTTGSYTVSIKNNSEVSGTVRIAVKVTNEHNIPVNFYYQLGTGGALQEVTLTDHAGTFYIDVPKIAALATATSDVVITWEWPFGGDDTSLGLNGTYQLTVNATVTFTQVD